MTTLGKLTITVKSDNVGNIYTEHETEFSPELSLMQSAMTEAEKLNAAYIRRKACGQAASFFLAVKLPGKGLTAQ